MAYETGTPSSVQDLVSKLFTFATANGWTQDQLDTGAGKAALSKGTVYVSFRWDTGSPADAALGIYHALGYSAGQDPGNHTDDSGNGEVSGTASVIDNGRCINGLGNSAFTAYHFFQDGDYVHVVLEWASGLYRHFGFGVLTKQGTWTGGEYCYGSFFDDHDPRDADNTFLLDGAFNNASNAGRAATVHAESLPNQPAASKWMQVWGRNSSIPNDRGGNAKVLAVGTSRCGPQGRSLGWLSAGKTSGHLPMVPIGLWYVDTVPSKDEAYYLGRAPAIRQMNMRHFAPGDEFTVGSDTWKVFPAVAKANAGSGEESRNLGYAYKKVT